MLEKIDPIEWQNLAENAIEFNPFYEPWFLLPHAEYVETNLTEAIIAKNNNELIGFVPLEKDVRSPWKYFGESSALKCLSSHYIHSFSPLIRNNSIESFSDSVNAFFVNNKKVSAISFGPLYEDSFLCQELQRIFFAQGILLWRRDKRPYFSSQLSAQEYLSSHMGGDHLKKLVKKVKKCGTLTIEIGYQEELIQEFLNLEASGWKGKNGTALQSQIGTKLFFEKMTQLAGQANRLSLARLTGESVEASKIIFSQGIKDFGFRICFDEMIGNQSPGSVLEYHLVHQRLDGAKKREADSCAKFESDLFNRIWKTHRDIVEVTVFRPSLKGKLIFQAIKAMQAIKK